MFMRAIGFYLPSPIDTMDCHEVVISMQGTYSRYNTPEVWLFYSKGTFSGNLLVCERVL